MPNPVDIHPVAQPDEIIYARLYFRDTLHRTDPLACYLCLSPDWGEGQRRLQGALPFDNQTVLASIPCGPGAAHAPHNPS